LVIHRKPEVAEERARRIRGDGLEADAYPVLGPSGFRLIRARPPDAILIDLTEMPSYGRTMAVLLREQKATGAIPLVFLKGDPEKAARVREVIPDAVFATWPDVAPAVLRAIRRAPSSAALRKPNVPLAQKLRIREDSVVALLHPPDDWNAILEPLPVGVRLQKQAGEAATILLFVKSVAALARALRDLAPLMKRGRTLWVCWPKRTSAERCELTANRIRQMASPYGMVDSKLCAMNATWSATALTLRAGY
jgi:CheY-like chemotaxis protein